MKICYYTVIKMVACSYLFPPSYLLLLLSYVIKMFNQVQSIPLILAYLLNYIKKQIIK